MNATIRKSKFEYMQRRKKKNPKRIVSQKDKNTKMTLFTHQFVFL